MRLAIELACKTGGLYSTAGTNGVINTMVKIASTSHQFVAYMYEILNRHYNWQYVSK